LTEVTFKWYAFIIDALFIAGKEPVMNDEFDEFRKQVQYHQKNLRQTQDTVLYAQHIISKEKDIGPGQCLRLVNSMKLIEEPLHKCYELLDKSELLPLPIKSRRHPLLIVLGYTNQLVQDLILSIGSLHIICKTVPQQQANLHRQYILEQLDALTQSKRDVVDNIDCLLLNAHRG
jgi:hypothetical protein